MPNTSPEPSLFQTVPLPGNRWFVALIFGRRWLSFGPLVDMSIVPILFAIAGAGLLVLEIWSFIVVCRAVKVDKISQQWKHRRNIAFGIGALLVLAMQFIPLQRYPLGDGTVAGIPFFAAWYDTKGRDFTGAVTLPAILGDCAVLFLLPQVVLAYFARRYLSSHGHNT
jgi:hypothetical protein